MLRTRHLFPLAVLAAAAGLTAAAAPAAAATSYTITDLGSLGYGVSHATGINAAGQVTGYSYLSTTVQSTCGYHHVKCLVHPSHAFVWDGTKMTDLGTLGGIDSVGNSINRTAEVAGWADNKAGVADAFLWDGTKMIDLGTLAAPSGSGSVATGLNDSGQVVGSWGNNPYHAWLYANGTVTSLPEPGYATAAGSLGCAPAAINNNGQIAGSCYDGNISHAVLWQNGTVTDLGTLGGGGSAATAINNLGQVAGWSETSTFAVDGFLYSNGTITDLGSFRPLAINDNGVMVGGTDATSSTPAVSQIYSGGTVQDLNNLIPANSGYQINAPDGATAINNNGQIAADANNPDHALLLTPG